MEVIAAELSDQLFAQLQIKPLTSRLIVGIGGIPASGKTTLARMVCTRLNQLSPGLAIVVPMDGWHYTRARLREFPDVKEAFDRRGAEWTFDAEGYTQFMEDLRQSASSSNQGDPSHSKAIAAPSFDHALKDPSVDAIKIGPSHHIILVEGLYVLLGTARWRKAANMLDERWFVDVDLEEAKARLVRRHVETGVADNREEALWRATDNDLPNGMFLIKNLVEPTRRIYSTADPTLSN